MEKINDVLILFYLFIKLYWVPTSTVVHNDIDASISGEVKDYN